MSIILSQIYNYHSTTFTGTITTRRRLFPIHPECFCDCNYLCGCNYHPTPHRPAAAARKLAKVINNNLRLSNSWKHCHIGENLEINLWNVSVDWRGSHWTQSVQMASHSDAFVQFDREYPIHPSEEHVMLLGAAAISWRPSLFPPSISGRPLPPPPTTPNSRLPP